MYESKPVEYFVENWSAILQRSINSNKRIAKEERKLNNKLKQLREERVNEKE